MNTIEYTWNKIVVQTLWAMSRARMLQLVQGIATTSLAFGRTYG